jgi:hypothetical protein
MAISKWLEAGALVKDSTVYIILVVVVRKPVVGILGLEGLVLVKVVAARESRCPGVCTYISWECGWRCSGLDLC